jgi:hypothetical protein
VQRSILCQLAEAKLGHDLGAFVDGLRTAEWGWRRISKEIEARTGLKISHEALRQWYGVPASERAA